MIWVSIVHFSEFQKVWIKEHGRDFRSGGFEADWTSAGCIRNILRSYFDSETRSGQVLFVEVFYGLCGIDQVFGRDPFVFLSRESSPIDKVFNGVSALLAIKYLFDLVFFHIYYQFQGRGSWFLL